MDHIQSNDANCNPFHDQSIEFLYWQLAAPAGKHKISRSMMGKLAKACNDYDKAFAALNGALKTRDPLTYIAKTIDNLKKDCLPAALRSEEPEVALLGRLSGWPVRQTKLDSGEPGWWVGGALYDKNSVCVGG